MSKERRPRYGTPDVYVTIYCKAKSHEGQPWIIATFTQGWDGFGRTYWHYSRDQYLMGQFVRRSTDRHETARVGADIDGRVELLDVDTPEGSLAHMRAQEDGTAVYADRLRCHLCGDVIRRTTANLHADLDVLAAAGQRDVDLGTYRRVVQR